MAQGNDFVKLLMEANAGPGVNRSRLAELGYKPVDGVITSPTGKKYKLVDEQELGFGLNDPFFYKLQPLDQSGGKKKRKTVRRRKNNKAKKSKKSRKSGASEKSKKSRRRTIKNKRRRRRQQRGGNKLFPVDGINQSAASCGWNPQPPTVGDAITNPADTLGRNFYELSPDLHGQNNWIENTSVTGVDAQSGGRRRKKRTRRNRRRKQRGGAGIINKLIPQDVTNAYREAAYSLTKLPATWTADPLPLSADPNVANQGLVDQPTSVVPIDLPKIINNADATAASA